MRRRPPRSTPFPYPTLSRSGVDRPAYLQGESLLPLVNGEADEVREAIFAEKTYHVAYEPERCARTHRYKYIRRFDDERSEEHTSELQSRQYLVCRVLLEKKK